MDAKPPSSPTLGFQKHQMPIHSEHIVKQDAWKPPKLRQIKPTQIESDIFGTKQLSPEKLTTALRASGWLGKHETIVKLQQNLLGQMFGLSGSVYLLHEIEYDPANTEKNAKLVLKFGGKAASFSAIDLEELFYTRLAFDDPLFPKCFAVFKYNTKTALAMEFLDHYSCFDKRDGIETPLLFAAIREMARLHAMYAGQNLEEVQSIGSPELRSWMIDRLLVGITFTQDAVQHEYGTECFIEMNHSKLDQEVNAYIDRLNASTFQSILHFDAWIHNWMFHEDLIDESKKMSVLSIDEISMQISRPTFATRGKVALLDWEYTSKGNGLVDYAFFFWTSALNAHELEETAASFYYNQLCYSGITNYTYSSFLNDYKDAKLYTFHRLISTYAHCMSPAYSTAEEWKNLRINMLQLLDDHVPPRYKKTLL